MGKMPFQNRGKRTPEIGSWTVVLLAVLVPLGVTAAGWGEGQRLTQKAAEKAAQTNAAAEDFPFYGYTQLQDPLLVLVNEKVALPEGWEVTPRLFGDEVVDFSMFQDLSRMVRDAEKENVWLWVASGYRSVERQQAVLDGEIQKNREAGMEESQARAAALRSVAEPGHSEHHTGLAVDFNEVGDGFAQTEACRWLREHGAEYGFIQRYPAGKEAVTGIREESWHYRYVGKTHAQAMKDLGLCLEEYVLYLKKQGVS